MMKKILFGGTCLLTLIAGIELANVITAVMDAAGFAAIVGSTATFAAVFCADVLVTTMWQKLA